MRNEEVSLSSKDEKLARFEAVIMPHLDAAYNLARWLTHHDHNAEDVVQEAYMRAYQYFDRFQGDAGRAWLLRIVRNTCYTWLDKNRSHQAALSFNEADGDVVSESFDAEAQLFVEVHREIVETALGELPPDLREVVVLREIEGLAYKEIAAVADVPIGTVMSRLARGRQQIHHLLQKRMDLPATQPKKMSDAGIAAPGTRPALGAPGSTP